MTTNQIQSLKSSLQCLDNIRAVAPAADEEAQGVIVKNLYAAGEMINGLLPPRYRHFVNRRVVKTKRVFLHKVLDPR